MDARKPAVVITGSSGFIGQRLGRALSDRFEVIGLDAKAPPDESAGRWIEMDIGSDAGVRRAIEEVRARAGGALASVVHLAAYYDFSGEPSPLYEEVTVRGTKRLLEALRGHTFRCDQFIFSSTMLVHAPCKPGQEINEDWPLDATWDYPRSKLQAEEAILAGRGSMRAVIFRIAGVYDDECHSIPLANQMQRIYERRLTSKVFPGDTSCGQAFIHLDDLADAAVAAVDRRRDLPPEAVILLGEEEVLSYDELQRTFAWLIHGEADWETARVPKAAAKAGAWVQDRVPGVEEPFIKPWMIDLADNHYDLDITRARKLLGWEPRRTLRESLPRMVESLKADPVGFYNRNKLEGSPPLAAAVKVPGE